MRDSGQSERHDTVRAHRLTSETRPPEQPAAQIAPSEPAVSVVMPCRNAELYIRQAIDSILGQTWQDFEFIIIDNASSDSTGAIVSEYAARDKRIRYMRNERDLGIAGSLNRGLRAARGEFIARMDADDIAVADRLEKQVAYMRSHPDCLIVGCNIVLIDAKGKRIGRREFAPQDQEIKRRMVAEIPFCHPATMLRREPVLASGVFYDERIRTVEDRDFWLRLADHGRYANLPEYLMYYRVSEIAMKYAECRRTVWDIVRLQLRWVRQRRFRNWRTVAAIATGFVLLLLPRSVITALYRFKHSH